MEIPPRAILTLLLVLQFLIYLDRGIIPGSIEELNAFIITALNTSKPNLYLGILQSAFVIGLSFACPIISHYSHRVSCYLLIAAGTSTWVVGAIICGASQATGYYTMLLTGRILTGVGEAALISLVPPLIMNTVDGVSVGLWMGGFCGLIPIGTALGFCYGSMLSASSRGWGSAFVMEAFVGIPFILIFFAITSISRSSDLASTNASEAKSKHGDEQEQHQDCPLNHHERGCRNLETQLARGSSSSCLFNDAPTVSKASDHPNGYPHHVSPSVLLPSILPRASSMHVVNEKSRTDELNEYEDMVRGRDGNEILIRDKRRGVDAVSSTELLEFKKSELLEHHSLCSSKTREEEKEAIGYAGNAVLAFHQQQTTPSSLDSNTTLSSRSLQPRRCTSGRYISFRNVSIHSDDNAEHEHRDNDEPHAHETQLCRQPLSVKQDQCHSQSLSFVEDFKNVLASRPFRWLAVAYSAYSASVIALSTFGASFLMDLDFVADPVAASVCMGILVAMSGVLGGVAGGWIASLAKRKTEWRKRYTPARHQQFGTTIQPGTTMQDTVSDHAGRQVSVHRQPLLWTRTNDNRPDLMESRQGGNYKPPTLAPHPIIAEPQNCKNPHQDEEFDSSFLELFDLLGMLLPILMMSITMLCLAAFLQSLSSFLIAIGLGLFGLFSTQAGLNIATMLSVPVAQRPCSIAAITVVLHLTGDVPSPILVGFLKDLLAPDCISSVLFQPVPLGSCHDEAFGIRTTIFLTTIWLVWMLVGVYRAKQWAQPAFEEWLVSRDRNNS